jgi:hypothetical protein
MKNSVNAKVAMARAKTPTPCAHVSADLDALANRDYSEMTTENALKPANAPPKSNQLRSKCFHHASTVPMKSSTRAELHAQRHAPTHIRAQSALAIASSDAFARKDI